MSTSTSWVHLTDNEPDEYPIQTDEVCPFCGQLIEWDGGDLYCEPCHRTWPDFRDVSYDRDNVKFAAKRAADAALWADDQRAEDESVYHGEIAVAVDRWGW